MKADSPIFMLRTLTQVFAFGGLAILSAGCSATKIADYSPLSDLSTRAATNEKSGLKITVDPFFDAPRSETYFKMNALKQGIVILHLRFENQAPHRTFMVHKQNFRYVTDTGIDQKAGETIHRSTAGGDAVALTGAGLLSLPLLFIGGQMVANAEAIRQNFISKELQNCTLADGESVSGFVYYQLPKNHTKSKSSSATFHLRVPPTNGGETVELAIPQTYEMH